MVIRSNVCTSLYPPDLLWSSEHFVDADIAYLVFSDLAR